ncbi:hypothetical protein LZK98_15665 [Sphingomonas cannabina]|uniref:hypothetical protein n=1 Tax=Sphingomonas cannabina TaxID=2899123 RepID=UPI001F1B0E7C|nr:hypothetical protein [Sphingomonas cannabina]UIJ44487.1 hypothetical protein LZK98_15665 [Sphingomonas cannabina]
MRGLVIFAAGVAGGFAAPAAMAQNSQSPMIITVPGVERYSLPPSGTQTPAPTPAPTPTPTPSAAPVAAPPPVVPTVRETSRPSPPAATLPPRTEPARAAPEPIATPTPSASPTPAITPTPSAPELPPAAAPSQATPAPAPSGQGVPSWLWLAGGAALALAAAAGAFLWRRGRRSDAVEEEELILQPEVAPTPPLAAAWPSPPPAPPSPALSPVTPAAPAQPLTVELFPAGVSIGNGAATVEFELAVINTGGQAADGIRIAAGMVAAGPDLEARIAAFSASAGAMPASEPLSLAPGEVHRARGSLTLPVEAMHVANVGGRPMVVPVVLIHLRWRGGLSIRGQGNAFMIGTGDAGVAKLGPIWLDRGQRRYAPVSARRFDPAPARPRAA